MARFADGSPAIVEHPYGDGCIRDVGFDFPQAGDVPLRESARRLIGAVAAPCANNERRDALDAARMDSLRGAGPMLATSALTRAAQEQSRATPWLLLVGALLLMAEVGVRQRVGRS